MIRLFTTVIIASTVCGTAAAQAAEKPATRSFEITPARPPTPALKYQLLFDDLADRRPGNAAILYLQTVLLMGPEAKDKGALALEAYEAHDMATFNKLAGELAMPSVFDELDLACRREECNWQPPFREKGAYTLLPHLEPLAHGITRLVKVKALRQIEQGEMDQAVETLRLGYVMANQIGHEPILISGLVSIAVTGEMNDALARLMNHPESPNLYWALRELPARQEIFRRAMEGERAWVATSVPAFMKLRSGEDLSADEWRDLLAYVWALVDVDREPSSSGDAPANHPNPVQAASKETREKARLAYAESHRMTGAEVDRVDPLVVLGSFYYQQYVNLFDDQYKLRGLPYPQLLPMAKAQTATVATIAHEQPENPFQVFGFYPAVERLAYADRELSALTAVEALRSYAAAHDGRLPAELSDVIETPVPNNPVTGAPFEYHVDGNTATLADSQSEVPLTYKVKIR